MVIYLCPTDKKYACSWEGSPNDIYDHFIMEHEDLLLHSNIAKIDLSEPSENLLMFFRGEMYLVQSKIADNKLAIYLRFLGSASIAEKITYQLVLIEEHVLGKRSWKIQNGVYMVDILDLKSKQEVITCQFIISSSVDASEDGLSQSDVEYCDILEDVEEANKEIENNIEDDEVKGGAEINCVHFNTTDREEIYENVHLREKEEHIYENIDNFCPMKSTNIERKLSFDERRKSDNNEIRRNHSLNLKPINEKSDDLTCTNCKNTMLPPIYLCKNKHNFCSDCKLLDVPCEKCEQSITTVRNEALEECSRKFLHSCKYFKHGCTNKYLYNSLRSHEAICKFCDYRCPFDSCTNVRGQFMKIRNHLKTIHGSVRIYDSLFGDFSKGHHFILANEEKGIFYCTYLTYPTCINWEVQFCGPVERNFLCELRVKHTKGPLFLKRNGSKAVLEISQEQLKALKVKEKNVVIAVQIM